MKKFIKQQYLNLMRKQGEKAGIVPVKNPDNEGQRIQELERLGVLEKDLDQDRRFNSLAQVATYLTGCSQCMINILGSTVQQCKANFGMNMMESLLTSEMPREMSVCQYSLAKPSEPLIIENILEDERTRNMQKLAVPPPFRFYAGSPLISSRGYALGTLCVLDPEPKNLEHKQIEGLRILSDQVVTLLETDADTRESPGTAKETGEAETGMSGQYYSSTSILFADIVGFTLKVEKTVPGELLEMLNTIFSGFDRITAKHKVRKVKTIGDCYMCVGGIPSQKPTHARKVCSVAVDMLQFMEGINIQQEALGKERWDLRIGIHTGPVIAGKSGNSFDIWGDTVNIAARMENSGEAGKIHISEKTIDYLDGAGSVTPRGEILLKGKGNWNTYFLEAL